MKIYTKNLQETQEVVNILIKNGFYNQETTQHEIRFVKSNGERDEIVPLWWGANKDIICEDEYSMKYFYVSMELKETLKKINPKIEHVFYSRKDDGEEIVTIVFVNGYKKQIYVTADSLKALAQDVIKEI